MSQQPLFYEGVSVPGVKPFRLGKTVITIHGNHKLVCMSAQFRYQRPSSYLQPLNLEEIYLITGLPQGNLSLSTIVGTSAGLRSFLTTYSSPCKLAENTISLAPYNECDPGSAKDRFTFSGLSISGLEGNVTRAGQGGNMMLMGVSLDFLAMSPY